MVAMSALSVASMSIRGTLQPPAAVAYWSWTEAAGRLRAMSTLILIRHGQSQWNSENRFTGWVDTPLSELGRKEAKLAGERLAARGVHVDRAFTSTLQRAIETGRIVLDGLG